MSKTKKSTVKLVEISIIVPIYNEAENIPQLFDELDEAINLIDGQVEIIAVDDGSVDDSAQIIQKIASKNENVKLISFVRNYGQTAALMAGIDYSTGSIIVTIDSDLQNDPRDIPDMIDKLNEGYDVVSGWRIKRQDSKFKKVYVSKVANRMISASSGVKLNDYGCTLKVYRRNVLSGMRLYGEMHRFVPIYANWMGAKITEVPVTHRPRVNGKSNYGLERIGKVALDVMVVRFIDKYFERPMHFFGGIGLMSLLLSLFSFVCMVALKLFSGISFIQTPLPIFVVMTFLAGVFAILIGLLAEMMVRTYYESQGRPAYNVRDVVDINQSELE